MSKAEKIRALKALAGSTKDSNGKRVYVDQETISVYSERFSGVSMGDFAKVCEFFMEEGLWPSIKEFSKQVGQDVQNEKSFLSGQSYEVREKYINFQPRQVVWWKDQKNIWWKGQVMESDFSHGQAVYQIWGTFQIGSRQEEYGRPLLEILRRGVGNVRTDNPKPFGEKIGNEDCELIGEKIEREQERSLRENLKDKLFKMPLVPRPKLKMKPEPLPVAIDSEGDGIPRKPDMILIQEIANVDDDDIDF